VLWEATLGDPKELALVCDLWVDARGSCPPVHLRLTNCKPGTAIDATFLPDEHDWDIEERRIHYVEKIDWYSEKEEDHTTNSLAEKGEHLSVDTVFNGSQTNNAAEIEYGISHHTVIFRLKEVNRKIDHPVITISPPPLICTGSWRICSSTGHAAAIPRVELVAFDKDINGDTNRDWWEKWSQNVCTWRGRVVPHVDEFQVETVEMVSCQAAKGQSLHSGGISPNIGYTIRTLDF
jgi:hypothetical protein